MINQIVSASKDKEFIQFLIKKTNDLEEKYENLLDTLFSKQSSYVKTMQTLFAPTFAYCVDTVDPLKQNQIRFYTPLLSRPEQKIKELPFARPVSVMGGHDDCGLTWIPPAGSRVVIVHQNGDRNSPLYIGTVPQVDRGKNGEYINYPIREFGKLYCDRGEGYLVGKKDGSQEFLPWNTENYNGYDTYSIDDFEKDVDAQKKISYPNIYGFKTPGKHWLKMVDGDYNCQNRWKRIELGSACGNWMIFKDDWLHPGGQWSSSLTEKRDDCVDSQIMKDLETFGTEDIDGNFSGSQPGSCIQSNEDDPCRDDVTSKIPAPANPYFKRLEETRPITGATNPQNNKLNLPQSGIQIQSRSGHQMIMDDCVEQPKGKKVKWQDTFNFGCTDVFLGCMTFRSATGHLIEMDDSEEVKNLRGVKNGIKMITAAGHSFRMCDHTLEGDLAGSDREISLISTSQHALIMNDESNEQASPTKRAGGMPTNKSKKAWVLLRSGYGLFLKMEDNYTQEETNYQSISLVAPRKDQQNIIPGVASGGDAAGVGASQNDECNQGHMLRMQLNGEDGGFVLVTSGGHYVCSSVKKHITEVGRKNCNADMIARVFGSYAIKCDKTIISQSKLEIIHAEDYVFLGAGKDCPPPDENNLGEYESNTGMPKYVDNSIVDAKNKNGKGNGTAKEDGPCFFPVIVAKCPWICPLTQQIHWTEKSMSDRVFASSRNKC